MCMVPCASLPLSGDGYVAAGDTYTLTLGDGLMNLGSGTDVSYTINWGDGTDSTTITADDLAAAGDQVTHVFPGMTSGNTVDISVDVNVGSISGSDTTYTTYTGVGGLSVTVDSTTATTTAVTLTNDAANLGDTAALQVIVTADVTELGITTGGVEFYEQLGTGATAALIDLGAGTLESPDVFVLRTPPLAAGDNNFIAVYSGDGFYQPSTSAALTVLIAGADDTLSIGGPSCAIAEGTDVSLSLPNDPYGNAITQWTINWGDGTPFGASSHAYGAPGTYTITALGQSSAGFFEGTTTVTVSSSLSASAPSDATVTVDNVEYSGADTEDGGSLAPDQLHVSFNGPAAAESYNVSIDWGDGSPATTFSLDPGQTSVTNPDEAGFDYPLQQYAANGTYGIIVTVTDAENNSASNSSTPFDVTYSNSAPSNLTLSLDQTTVSAGSGEPNLSGSFTEPQPNILHVVTVDWGDGTEESPDITTVVLAAGQTTFTAQPNSTTYATAGDYTITATVAGMDGSTSQSTTVTVATTTTTLSVPSTGTYGDSVTLTATVSPTPSGAGTPTGEVDFFNQTTGMDLGTGTLNAGVATLSVSNLAAGDDSIVASYYGDDNFPASDSSVQTIAVSAPALSIDDVEAPSTIVKGGIATLSGTVANIDGGFHAYGQLGREPGWGLHGDLPARRHVVRSQSPVRGFG